MEFFSVTLLNGLSYGLLLFLLSSGLTLIFSMLGVLNFAHASFYMLGAYLASTLSARWGFWLALPLAPLLTGVMGALVERYGLRRVRRHGHLAELMFTFGLGYVMLELVQLAWGRGTQPYAVPPGLQGTLFLLYSTAFPIYRGFMLAVALLTLVLLAAALRYSRAGLLIQAALQHPSMVQALGHDVPRLYMLTFGGGCALAGLAGVLGGNAFVTEPGMAATVGNVVFVVVVLGGLGSLAGAFCGSLLIGLLQTAAVSIDYSMAHLLAVMGVDAAALPLALAPLWQLSLAQMAPVLPYMLLVPMLIFRPRGLLGRRAG
ncbi:branched-chain amino acid ABC transporter permease [Herbaspirillum sp. RTI4]|uniref:branched-chain amino acid ABC transporter permease n=1 Tax=Herbaspirillum sp. RTI4 TaxID=3048640 RepID=UPI002AB4E1E9|nr:branched-chain amino acid ABC transporter permease [Herbaspirillum sp. RTI4]MDY7578843.1 branched-chain amino acid ABC transporter permease [Herbaspirillum sp. RTI4]MEA9982697.1 branched-chain amino acid ABC transporter permease [Herbaspirillum sp. RTI4]